MTDRQDEENVANNPSSLMTWQQESYEAEASLVTKVETEFQVDSKKSADMENEIFTF